MPVIQWRYGQNRSDPGVKEKPEEKQTRLVAALLFGEIPVGELIAFFEKARNADQGACADAFKHISAQKPELLAPFIDLLIGYINHPLPRVKWGVPEAIGNLAKDYPDDELPPPSLLS